MNLSENVRSKIKERSICYVCLDQNEAIKKEENCEFMKDILDFQQTTDIYVIGERCFKIITAFRDLREIAKKSYRCIKEIEDENCEDFSFEPNGNYRFASVADVHHKSSPETDYNDDDEASECRSLIEGQCGNDNARGKTLDSSSSAVECPDCQKTFKNTLYLRKHQKNKHVRVMNVCSVCNKAFDSLPKFRYHLKSHEPEKRYKCRHCSKSFLQGHHLSNHESAIHGSETKMRAFLCSVCGNDFKRKVSLVNHMRAHRNDSSGNSKASEKFDATSNEAHYEEKARHTMPYECDMCKRKFKLLSSLTRHMTAAHSHGDDASKRKHECAHCSQSFKRAEHLRIHVNRIHLKKRPFVCTFEGCGKSFSQTGDRNVHAITHTKHEEKKFSCKHAGCGKSFRLAKTRNQHEKIHTGLRTFLCEICKLSFMTYASVKRHSHKVHHLE